MRKNNYNNKKPAKDDNTIEVDGVVTFVHANARFDVDIGDGVIVNAYLAGKMRQHFIRVLAGDKVTIVVSMYDPSQGRIIRRYR